MSGQRLWTRGMTAVALVTGASWYLLHGKAVEHDNVAFDLSPDGRQIAFAAADGDLYVHTLGTRKVVRLTRTNAEESSPRFSPDGRSIVYSVGDPDATGSSLYVIATSGGVPKRITRTSGVWDISPVFSRDGKQVAFARAFRRRPYSMGGYTWDNFDLCAVRADGTGEKRLTNEKYYSMGAARTSSDGRGLLFSAEKNLYPRRLTATVLRVGVGGGVPKEVTTGQPEPYHGGAWAHDLAVSRSGETLAVISDRQQPFAYDIWLLAPDGKPLRALGITKTASYNQNPVFYPDGKRLLYLAGTKKGAGNRSIFSLWEVGVDGNGARQVADSGLFTDPQRWMNR